MFIKGVAAMKKIAVLQIDSVVGDVQANLSKIDNLLGTVNDPEVRLAVFCEYGLTGYCTDLTEVADTVPGNHSAGLEELAKEHNIWICGGTAELAGGKIANTSLMVSPGGLEAKYRKVHPFGSERGEILAGEELVTVDTELGKVGMTICYDFMFPEYVRALALAGAEIILNSTFWFSGPVDGALGWEPECVLSMARTRAMENSVYVAMACRTGQETAPWGDVIRGFGHSSIVSPVGKTIARTGLSEAVITAPVETSVTGNWKKYANHLDSRRPEMYRSILDI